MTDRLGNEQFLEIPLEGETVLACVVDHAFTLQIGSEDADTILRIEGRFHIDSGDNTLVLSPERKLELGAALSLFDRTIADAKASKDGALEIAFQDGTVLRVGPDAEFEAWELSSTNGLRLVSMPGGELAIWGKDE